MYVKPSKVVFQAISWWRNEFWRVSNIQNYTVCIHTHLDHRWLTCSHSLAIHKTLQTEPSTTPLVATIIFLKCSFWNTVGKHEKKLLPTTPWGQNGPFWDKLFLKNEGSEGRGTMVAKETQFGAWGEHVVHELYFAHVYWKYSDTSNGLSSWKWYKLSLSASTCLHMIFPQRNTLWTDGPSMISTDTLFTFYWGHPKLSYSRPGGFWRTMWNNATLD